MILDNQFLLSISDRLGNVLSTFLWFLFLLFSVEVVLNIILKLVINNTRFKFGGITSFYIGLVTFTSIKKIYLKNKRFHISIGKISVKFSLLPTVLINDVVIDYYLPGNIEKKQAEEVQFKKPFIPGDIVIAKKIITLLRWCLFKGLSVNSVKINIHDEDDNKNKFIKESITGDIILVKFTRITTKHLKSDVFINNVTNSKGSNKIKVLSYTFSGRLIQHPKKSNKLLLLNDYWSNLIKVSDVTVTINDKIFDKFLNKLLRADNSPVTNVKNDSSDIRIEGNVSKKHIENVIKAIICPYKTIIENLKIFDVKFENLIIRYEKLKISLNVSSSQVHIQTINDVSTYNELLESTYNINEEGTDTIDFDNASKFDDDNNDFYNEKKLFKFDDIELSVSFNAVNLYVQKKSMLRIPLINILVTTDLIQYFLSSDIKYNELKISFSLNVLNPTILISLDQITNIANNIQSRRSNLQAKDKAENGTMPELDISSEQTNTPIEEETDELNRISSEKKVIQLILENIPSFLFEVTLSNFNFYIQISEFESINFKVYEIKTLIINNYNAILKTKNNSREIVRKSRLFEKLPIKDPLIKDLSNFVKVINASLSYKRHNYHTSSEVIPIYNFERCVVILDDLSPEKFNFVTTLRKSDFTLLDIGVLEKLISTYLNVKDVLRKIKAPKKGNKSLTKLNKESHFANIDWSAKFRVKDFSISVLIANYLPALLDPIHKDGENLSEVIRGFTLVFHETVLMASRNKRDLSITKISLIRVMDDFYSNDGCDDIVKFQDFQLTDNFDHIMGKYNRTVLFPKIYLKFDINIIWLVFYLKKIFSDHASILKNKEESPKDSKLSKKASFAKFSLTINKIIFEINLPKDTPLLFIIKRVEYNNSYSQLRIGYILGHVKSVYVHHLPVNVELLHIKNIEFSTKSVANSKKFIINTDRIRLHTEYHFKFYMIVTNIIMTFKSFKQLSFSFSDLSQFQRFHPKVEIPKRIPCINLCAKEFLIDVEEDPFEQELGLIFKIGVLEQRERLQKLLEFEEQKSVLKEFDNFNNTENLHDNGQHSENFEDQARQRLYENFSTSWIERYRNAKLKFHGMPYHVQLFEEFENTYYRFSGKAASTVANLVVQDLDMTIQEPSFPVEQFSDFIFKMGKGVPKSMEYTILVLLGIDIKTSLWQLKLRDYPIPVITFPDTHTTGDIVFAEKMPDNQALWNNYIPFVPSAHSSEYIKTSSIYGSHIIGTMNSIKTYFNINTKVRSNSGSSITWGKSLQPGYQSLMMWFDFLSKPQMDPSPKLGFWDKFRFLIHGSWKYEFSENSDLRLNIKGAHNPYKITDDGAGLSFSWSGGTVLQLNGSSNPQEFLLIKSKRFRLAVPNFTEENNFDKILMDLNGDVKWTLGLMFEQGNLFAAGDEKRLPPTRPHHDVTLINPEYVYNRNDYDSWNGFRTNFIHMSIGVYSFEGSTNNNIYLAPYTMTHFFKWWRLFDTYTSGPIRQGSLFPQMIQNKNKFGRSLFTIKYQLHLSPLTVTHVYRHVTAEDDNGIHSSVTFTGIKCKTKSLKIDLHQKRIKLTHTNEKLNKSKPIWKFRMSKGELDCEEADFRLISTVFDEAAVEKTLASRLGLRCKEKTECEPEGLGNLKSSDWFDIEDYIDLDQITLQSTSPINIDVKPFLSSPRMTYFRKINDDGYKVNYPFGSEPSHRCLIGKNHPERTQEHLARKRGFEIQDQIKVIQEKIATIEALLEKNPDDHKLQAKKHNIYAQFSNLVSRSDIIDEILSDIKMSETMPLDGDIRSNYNESILSGDLGSMNENPSLLRMNTLSSFVSMRRGSTIEANSSFDNRFMVHNVRIKIDNAIKNHLLQYASSSLERKSTQFYFTYKSVLIVKELLSNFMNNSKPAITEYGSFADDGVKSSTEFIDCFEELIRKVPNDNYEAIDSYLIQLISPQVQITSDIEPDSAVVLAATEIETGIIDVTQVMSRSGKIIDADVNTVVESRYCSIAKELQVFSLFKKDLSFFNRMGLLSLPYEGGSHEHSWVPWLPLELCFDGNLMEAHIVLKRRSLFLTYTAPNPLFFSDNEVTIFSSDARMHIGFPNLTIACTSQQYNSVYNIAQELMSFGTSLDEKVEKLSKILLADEVRNNIEKLDISVVVNLQKKIKELYYCREFLQTYDQSLYRTAGQDLTLEIQATQLELSVLMTAIKKNYDSIGTGNNSRGLLNWKVSTDELIWELSDSENKPFITIGLGPSSFVRSQTTDGSNSNVISIKSLQIYNQQQKMVYQQLVAPFEENSRYNSDMPMLEVFWLLSSPVGGISVLEEMIVSFQPIIFKMDYITADKLMNYLFPKTESSNDDSSSNMLKKSNNQSIYNSMEISSKTSSPGSISPSGNRRSIDPDYPESVKSGEAASIRDPRRISTTFLRQSDDSISEMVKRAGTYVNIKSVIIKKMIMSISYKGSHSLLTNVDELIVKVPTLQYRDKIWSRDEFFAAIKRDVIKIVLQHTGNIIGNKFIPHKKENRKKLSTEISKLLKSNDDKKDTRPRYGTHKVEYSSLSSKRSRHPPDIIITEENEDDGVRPFFPDTS